MKTIITKLPNEGFCRIGQILSVFPISKSGWYQGIQDGIYPKPIRAGKNISLWKVEDIKQLLAEVANGK